MILSKYPWDKMIFHLTLLNIEGMLCLALLLSLPSKGLAAVEQSKTFLLHQLVDGRNSELRGQLFNSELFTHCFLACLDTLKGVEGKRHRASLYIM